MGSSTGNLFWQFLLPTIAVSIVFVVAVVAMARGIEAEHIRIEAEHIRRLRQEGRTITCYVRDLGIDTSDLGDSSLCWIDVSGVGDFESTRVYVEYDQYMQLRKGSSVAVTYLPGQRGSARVLR